MKKMCRIEQPRPMRQWLPSSPECWMVCAPYWNDHGPKIAGIWNEALDWTHPPVKWRFCSPVAGHLFQLEAPVCCVYCVRISAWNQTKQTNEK
jgi:hypothetical protein